MLSPISAPKLALTLYRSGILRVPFLLFTYVLCSDCLKITALSENAEVQGVAAGSCRFTLTTVTINKHSHEHSLHFHPNIRHALQLSSADTRTEP